MITKYFGVPSFASSLIRATSEPSARGSTNDISRRKA